MNEDDDIDVDALEQRFTEALARSHELPRTLSPDEITTLALAPFWTEPALTKVLGQPVEAVLARAGTFLHVEGELGGRAISVREPGAPALIAMLRGRRAIERWAAIAREVAVLDDLPPVLRAWAELTASLADRPDYELARTLLSRVAADCDAGRPGEVHDLVDAAAALARALGPPLSGAVRAAQHRLQRWYAVQRDRRKLAHFVPRRDAIAAIDRLVNARDPAAPWALHVVGAAGMGKTSLIRHLSTEIAAQHKLQVARIDFDHLSPAYPAHEPGQLIASLAYELTALIETEAQDKMIGFVESALDGLRDLAPRGLPFRALLDRTEMQELMAWFGSLLQLFSRPVLVLDTCEELSKLELEDGVLPSVEATFLILERLHAQAPHLRVVLAGRRLLAHSYANWTAGGADPHPTGVAAARPYLTLHELRGFDAGEARAFLADSLPPARRDDRALIDKLLALSPEPVRVSALAAVLDPEPRYNPFDLSRYAEWVEADPRVALTDLETSTADPYVEVRIMQRMGELEPLLPAIALLRQFDAAMLAPAVPAGTKPLAIFDQLARHEWLRASHQGGRTVLEVDRGLPARIERCIAAHRGAELATARAALCPPLREAVDAAPLLRIPVEVHDAALRLLPAEDAVALWQRVEARIGEQADWAWAAKLTRDLIATGRVGDPAAGPDGAATLVALAIRATHASALVHAGGSGELASLWQAIGRGAAAIDHDAAGAPSPAWLLQQRARLGVVSARAIVDHTALPSGSAASDPAGLVAEIVEVADALAARGAPGAWASSRCAAIEAVVEFAERTPERAAPALWRLIPRLGFDDPAFAAFAVVLRARIEALEGPPQQLDAIHPAVLPDPIPPLSATVLDWRPPDSLTDQLRLEVVRRCELLDLSGDPANRAVVHDAAATWLAWADQASATICGDRLRSAVITVLGSAAQTTTAGALDASAEPRGAAHRQYPPLAFTHGRVALARGELTRARTIARQLPRPWAQRLSCELARWTRDPVDLAEHLVIDDLDTETKAAIAAARAVVSDVLPDDARALLPRDVGDGSVDFEPVQLHTGLRIGALRASLRRCALDARELGAACSERKVMAAIEEAELLGVAHPVAALHLLAWAVRAAAELALRPAHVRAGLGQLEILLRGSAETGSVAQAKAALLGAIDAVRPGEYADAARNAMRQAIAQRWRHEATTKRGDSAALPSTTLGVEPTGAIPFDIAAPRSARRQRLRIAVLALLLAPIPIAFIVLSRPASLGHGHFIEIVPRDAESSLPDADADVVGLDAAPPADSRTTVFDGGVHNTHPRDAGIVPTARRDASFDIGSGAPSPDARELDAGELDAGELDAGELDAGAPIAWHPDAGSSEPITPTASGSAGHPGWWLNVLIALGAVGIGLVVLLRRLASRRTKDVAIELTARLDAMVVGSGNAANLDAARLIDAARIAQQASREQARATVIVTRLSPTAAELTLSPDPAAAPIRRPASITGRGEWPVIEGELADPLSVLAAAASPYGSIAIASSPDLASRCWEGALCAVARDPTQLAFHRMLPRVPVPRPDLAPARIEADGSLAEILERTWRGKRGIVHVVRRFGRSRRGYVELTHDYGRDILVERSDDPSALERDINVARLVIVQCDPSTAEVGTRANTAEPELAREFLVGTLQRSTACGLVIPPVRFDVFRDVAEMLSLVGRCTPAELIATTRELRACLHARSGSGEEITLFLREGQPD